MSDTSKLNEVLLTIYRGPRSIGERIYSFAES